MGGALARQGPRLVAVAYADWRQAQAPPVDDVVRFACERLGTVLLIDTWSKSPGWTLLDYLSRRKLLAIGRHCQARGVRLALAGSLGLEEIWHLLDARPTWFAVRGAVCHQGRSSAVSAARVCRLASLLQVAVPLARHGS
jgi:uncharacterized protein (UPF0264 family)